MTRAPRVTVDPALAEWAELARRPATGSLQGRPMVEWRVKTRRELGLADDGPIVATGHQTLLWHPGILAKYLAVEAVARRHELARANLIVDQHAGGFGELDVPVRGVDGSLVVRRIVLTRARAEVPMSRHEAFTPDPLPPRIPGAAPHVEAGLAAILAAVHAHRCAPNAAAQMAGALEDLMAPWVAPMPSATATELLETTLGRAIVEKMVRDPWRCAACYNAAVAARPDAGITPLLLRDDYVELPLWRLRPDDRRMPAYDSDAERWLEDPTGAPALMPRALMLTALVRLGMADLFIHGTGGANYDRVMEGWVRAWLDLEPAPIAVATADVYLPLTDHDEEPDPEAARIEARRVWHDPESAPDADGPGEVKRDLLAAIASTPWGSPARRRAYFTMHRELAVLRSAHVGRVEKAQREAREAERLVREAEIAGRRDWAFALYERAEIDRLWELVRAAGATVTEPATGSARAGRRRG